MKRILSGEENPIVIISEFSPPVIKYYETFRSWVIIFHALCGSKNFPKLSSVTKLLSVELSNAKNLREKLHKNNYNTINLCLQQSWTSQNRWLDHNYQISNMRSTPTIQFPMYYNQEISWDFGFFTKFCVIQGSTRYFWKFSRGYPKSTILDHDDFSSRRESN